MIEFKPTFLYIKKHNITGLQYFGKTVSKNPIKYKGSGKHWLRHLEKYGNDVTTVWYQLFTDKESITRYALNFSNKNQIVESKEWANLRPEDGLWGGGVKGIKLVRTPEHNKKIADSVRKTLMEKGQVPKVKIPKEKKGRSKGGWKWSDEDRAKLSAQRMGQRMGRTPWNKGKSATDS